MDPLFQEAAKLVQTESTRIEMLHPLIKEEDPDVKMWAVWTISNENGGEDDVLMYLPGSNAAVLFKNTQFTLLQKMARVLK
jgi:hypothetical protein